MGKLRDILAALDHSSGPEGMDLPGFRLHALEGRLKGHYAVLVSGNWRVTFRFEDGAPADIEGTCVLALLGQTVTTDRISPAGAIPRDESAGRYLQCRSVTPIRFTTFAARCGNHEVMMCGTLGDVRLRILLVDGKVDTYTVHMPSGEMTTIFETSERYRAVGNARGRDRRTRARNRRFARLDRKEDDAPRCPGRGRRELRAHPPLQPGGDWRAAAAVPGWRGAERLGLTGGETYDMTGTTEGLEPGARVSVNARREDGSIIAFEAVARLDSDVEVEYYRSGGILREVLRRMATA